MPTKRTKQAKKKVADATSGLQDLIDSADDLLESLKDQPGAAAEKLRGKVSETVRSARALLSELDVPEVASEAVEATVGFLRSDPRRTVALGVLAVLAVFLVVRGSGDQ